MTSEYQLWVQTVDGHEFKVELNNSADVGTQARQILEQGAVDELSRGPNSYYPPHRISRVMTAPAPGSFS